MFSEKRNTPIQIKFQIYTKKNTPIYIKHIFQPKRDIPIYKNLFILTK